MIGKPARFPGSTCRKEEHSAPIPPYFFHNLKSLLSPSGMIACSSG